MTIEEPNNNNLPIDAEDKKVVENIKNSQNSKENQDEISSTDEFKNSSTTVIEVDKITNQEIKKFNENNIKESADNNIVTETLSQKNAIKKATNYLIVSGFSKKGLISQLE